MCKGYPSVLTALAGSLILSIAVMACGTSPSPAWITVTAETQEKAIAEAVNATMTAVRNNEEAQRAAAERRAKIEAGSTATAEAIATNEANPTYQARKATVTAKRAATATFQANNPPTPTPLPPRGKPGAMGVSVPGWLITDVENITKRMRAINPYLSSCPLSSSERSNYMRRLEKYQLDSRAVAQDANDGSIDDYDIEDLVSITNDGFEIVSELELKCR